MKTIEEIQHEQTLLAATQANIAQQQAQLATDLEELKNPKSWSPKRGPLAAAWGSQGGHRVIEFPSMSNEQVEAGISRDTVAAVEERKVWMDFYSRLHCLACELNPSGRAGGAHNVFIHRGHWKTNATNYTKNISAIFETREAAEEAAKILNRDGWVHPADQ